MGRRLFSMPGAKLRDARRRLTARGSERISSVRDFAGTTPGSRLGLLLLVAALSGLLVAGLALPWVGTVALTTKAGTELFEELPGELATTPLDEKSTLLAADGSVLATYYYTNRRAIPLSEVPQVMQNALKAIEDARFDVHGGIDLKGTLRAFVSTNSGQDVQGGSTLTQQYVKNALIEAALANGDEEAAKAARTRSRGAEGYARKLRELRYAATLEKTLSKQEILERYLNIAYFGNGAYGIQSAAERYFSKPARDLQIHEAALLAGFVQNPTDYDPFTQPRDARDRRDTVLNRMAETGFASAEEVASAKRRNLGLKRSSEQSGCETVVAGAFCDYIRRLVSDNPAFGELPEDRRDLLFSGGLTIKSTLDPRMQKAAQEGLNSRVFASDPVIGTTVTVEPGTGHIKAMANSKGFGEGPNEEEINYAGDFLTGGSRGISPGSTFKIFASAVALDQGFGLRHTINSPYRVNIPFVKRCPNLKDVESYKPIEGYTPRNERTDENGNYTQREAFAKSINTYYLQLQSQIDGNICPIAQLTDKLGLKRAGDGQPLDQRSDFAIGRNEVSPTAMVAAYATFPARGKFCPPTPVTEILDRNGKPIGLPDFSCKQVMKPEVADAVNEMGRASVRPGGTGIRALLDDGRDQAGKTGTHERQTVWYMGYTPNLSTGVAIYKPHARTEADKALKGFKIGGISPENGNWGGYNLPAPTWKAIMEGMVPLVPQDKFTPMDPKFETGTRGNGASQAPDTGTGGDADGEEVTGEPRRAQLPTVTTPRATATRTGNNGAGDNGRASNQPRNGNAGTGNGGANENADNNGAGNGDSAGVGDGNADGNGGGITLPDPPEVVLPPSPLEEDPVESPPDTP